MKKILYIATGGTISSIDKGVGLEPNLKADEILEYCSIVKEFCKVDAKQLFNLDSTNIGPDHWLQLAKEIQDNYDDYDGFVISHGTDTMAYTAAALSYLIQNSKKPIVLTGAQKPINTPTSDAIANLTDAFIYACDDKSSGVQIVFFGSVIIGTRARKNYSKSYFAFGSINYPEIARIQDGMIIRFIDYQVNDDVKFYTHINHNVGLIKFTPGMRVDVLAYLINQYDGIIVESYGVGGLPEYSDFYNEIKKAAKEGKIIVMTTQVANEGSNLSTYKVGMNLKENINLLEAHDMTSEAALCKIMWCLGQSDNFKTIEDLFYKTIGYDILYK